MLPMPFSITSGGHFPWYVLSQITARRSNHMQSKVWDKITNPSPNFNGYTVEVWEWISDFIPHFMMDIIIYPCWDNSWTIYVRNRDLWQLRQSYEKIIVLFGYISLDIYAYVICLVSSQFHPYTSGVGVTKAPFVNFSVSKIFDLAKVHVRFLESHSYLTSVPAAQLRWHLSNINAIFNS